MDKNYNWYTIYVKSHHEKRVYKDLSEQKIQAFLPLRKINRKWSDRLKLVEEPLFANYIFVKISCREYLQVLNLRSVFYFISFDRGPYVVSENVIQAIKDIISRNISFEITSQTYAKGDIIEFSKGPFKGMSGEVLNIEGSKYLIIKMEHINQAIIIKTGRKYLVNQSQAVLCET